MAPVEFELDRMMKNINFADQITPIHGDSEELQTITAQKLNLNPLTALTMFPIDVFQVVRGIQLVEWLHGTALHDRLLLSHLLAGIFKGNGSGLLRPLIAGKVLTKLGTLRVLKYGPSRPDKWQIKPKSHTCSQQDT